MSEDRHAIEDLVARFDDAVNRRDVGEFRTLWSETATWEIGPPRALRVSGRDAIVETWTHALGGTELLFRGTFMGVVELDGDAGRGRWPCIETGTFAATDATPAQGYDNRAYYDDRYVREDGIWRFRSRSYHYLWLSDERLPGAPVIDAVR